MYRFPRSDPDRVPVLLLTGFLGSGKTTLLNGLLQHPEMARTAVIVNEFGDIPLDQHFIDAALGEVIVLGNGCLCCSMQGDFEGVIGTLYARRQQGALPPFERIVVETTGLADPAPIMQVLLNQPLVVDNFCLEGVITTVDAVHAARQVSEHAEAVKQIALADRLIITKTDLAAGHEVDAISALLQRLNPGAPQLRSTAAAVPPASVMPPRELAADSLTQSAAESVPRDLAAESPLQRAATSVAEREGGGAGSPGHLHAIHSFSLQADRPLPWTAFDRWLRALRIRHADALLRVKGIIEVEGEADPVAIHAVHHVMHPPVRLNRPALRGAGSRLVIITRGLTREEAAAGWETLAASSSATSAQKEKG